MVIWLTGYTCMYLSVNPAQALEYARTGFFGIIFIPVFAYHFIVRFLEQKKSIFLRCLYLMIFPSVLLHRTQLVYFGIDRHFWGYYPIAGPLYPVFLVTFTAAFSLGVFKLIQAYRLSIPNSERKTQITYLLFAFGAGCTGLVDYITKLPGVNIYPWGYVSALIFIYLISCSIVRHRLMGIEIIIKHATVYTIMFLTLYGSFVLSTFIFQTLFSGFLHTNKWVVNIPTLLLVIIAARPLENWLREATDKYLFQKPYDYKELLKIFTNEVLTVLDLDKVAKNTVDGLDNIIKLDSCAVILKKIDQKKYYVSANKSGSSQELQVKEDCPLISYIESSKTPLLKKDFKNITALKDYEGSLFYDLRSELIVPIIYSREVIGMIVLGKKKSGEDYNKEDVDVLASLAGTVGIATSNARLYRELSQTQAEAAQSEKMAVIGTLASGINHEICNPLGIVRGHCEVFLLNFKDGLYKNIDKDKLLDQVSKTYEKIIAQIDRATGITKRLSAFAKPNKLFKKEPIDAGHEVEEVLQILAHEMRIHNIEVKNELPANYPKIMCDKKQIQEVMFNIIRNAAQAMKGNGMIQIDGARNGVRAWINIKDTGPGITPEQQAKIFHPFFTTKQPGEGTGLGLYIVKQIVEKNDGTIELSSTPGEGATFKLTFKIAEEECLKS